MSTYNRYTVHPETGRWEAALWIDDFYERHHYGVKFPDGKTFDPWKVTMRSGDLTDIEAEILNEHGKGYW